MAQSFPVQDLWLPGWHMSRTKCLCFPSPLVPAHLQHSRNFPLDHNTFSHCLGQNEWKCTTGEETTTERKREKKEEEVTEIKTAAGTCNLRKKTGTGHFRGLDELNELKTKASKNDTITLQHGSLCPYTTACKSSLGYFAIIHSFTYSFIRQLLVECVGPWA